ncbi:hypothetical protein [Nostoc sp.]
MLRPVCHKTDEHRSYLQALDDFGIAELLARHSVGRAMPDLKEVP